MSRSYLQCLAGDELEMVIGGISVPGGGGLQQPQPQEDDRPWVDRLTDNLRRRGLDSNIDPKMEIRPPNADMDQGIIRQLPSGGRQWDI